MSEIDQQLAGILDCLGQVKLCATYGAVAAVGSAMSVGGRLGARRRGASWVVNSKSGLPSGYAESEIDPGVRKAAIIRSGAELKRVLAIWKAETRD